MNEVMEKMSNWSEKNGIYPISFDGLKMEYIMELCNKDINSIDLKEINVLLLKIAAYNTFLKSQKGSVLAKLIIMEGGFKRNLNLAINNLRNNDKSKWRTRDELEAIVLESDFNLSSTNEELLLLKAQYNKIKDLPYSLDQILDNIKLVYNRKINERTK